MHKQIKKDVVTWDLQERRYGSFKPVKWRSPKVIFSSTATSTKGRTDHKLKQKYSPFIFFKKMHVLNESDKSEVVKYLHLIWCPTPNLMFIYLSNSIFFRLLL